MKRVTLILADDNPAILSHVKHLVADECDILATASNGEMALREAERLQPDVLVLDISMGTLTGIEVARCLQTTGCTCRIVFLTVHKDPYLVQAALDAGGLAYVVKSCVVSDLLPAIRAVLEGKLFLSAPLRNQPPP
ncbi:MAG TPA: response regulator transcription factor [Terriglobales bacterium]